MNNGVLLSESETDTSEVSGRQSELISGDESIKGKLEEFSAKLNELRLADGNSDGGDEEESLSPDTKSQREESSENSENVSRSTSRPPLTSSIVSSVEREQLKSQVKVKIRLQPIGAIPQIQPRVCQISAHQQFLALTRFLCKRLKRKHIHCYINNAFAPSLDQNIGDLWTQFKVNDELIVSYCETVAFG